MQANPNSEDLRSAVPGFEPRSVVVTRTVRGPRELVWRMWTESEHLAAWWGPHGFTNPECGIDPRPGGHLHILMRSPDGEEYLNVGTVESVRPPETLVFTVSLVGGDGRPRLTNHTTVELVDRGAATEVTVRVRADLVAPEAAAHLAGMRDGWRESLARLADTVKHAEQLQTTKERKR